MKISILLLATLFTTTSYASNDWKEILCFSKYKVAAIQKESSETQVVIADVGFDNVDMMKTSGPINGENEDLYTFIGKGEMSKRDLKLSIYENGKHGMSARLSFPGTHMRSNFFDVCIIKE